MPVILNNGSDDLWTWLDPKRTEWTKELQSLLKPFDGELECYAVNKEVGKVGNNSPDFIVPVASSKNKSNIANFFANAERSGKGVQPERSFESETVKRESQEVNVADNEDDRKTINPPRTEDNAPIPAPQAPSPGIGTKRSRKEEDEDIKPTQPDSRSARSSNPSPMKKKVKSATSNGTVSKPGAAKSQSNQKITSFFGT